VENISNPNLSRYLRSFISVSDAIGDYLFIDGKHFYMLTFPSEQKTIVYDIAMNQWYEWSYWNANTQSAGLLALIVWLCRPNGKKRWWATGQTVKSTK
jgi:hypothetical protein